MPSIVAVLDKEMTKVPTKLQLDGFKDMNIKDICSCEFRNDADNHCAHFVSHAMGFAFGYTCKSMTGKGKMGASIRVHEVFAMCGAVGAWVDRTKNVRAGLCHEQQVRGCREEDDDQCAEEAHRDLSRQQHLALLQHAGQSRRADAGRVRASLHGERHRDVLRNVSEVIGGAGDGAFAVAGFAQGPRALVMLLAAQCVLAGCNNEATVSADYQRDQIVPRAQTVVTFDDGFHHYAVTGGALTGTGTQPRYHTLTSGTLRVRVDMADASGAIAVGSVMLPLRSDWGYGISVAIDSVNPRRSCFGCAGSAAFPLRSGVGRSPRDSLWLTWGGNSISNPVDY